MTQAIEDLIYGPIEGDEKPIDGPRKTFQDLCARRAIDARQIMDARQAAAKRKADIERDFTHLRGKLVTRGNADGTVDVVHKDLAKRVDDTDFVDMAVRRELSKMRRAAGRRTQFGLRRGRI